MAIIHKITMDISTQVSLKKRRHILKEKEEGYEKVLSNMGYRLWISEAVWKNEGQRDCLRLSWNNDGGARFIKTGRYICIWRIHLENWKKRQR